jgi:hypothetical protein
MAPAVRKDAGAFCCLDSNVRRNFALTQQNQFGLKTGLCPAGRTTKLGSVMKTAPVTEVIELGRKLSPGLRREWLNYGRYLSTQEEKPPAVEEDGDAAWERIVADSKPRPKLAAMAAKALAEHRAGKTTPMLRS